jgi:hypothetical protein
MPSQKPRTTRNPLARTMPAKQRYCLVCHRFKPLIHFKLPGHTPTGQKKGR